MLPRLTAGALLIGGAILIGCGADDGDTTIINKTVAGGDVGEKVLVGDEYKPAGRWCPTLRTCLSDVSWTKYGRDEAVGVGDAKDCAPGGPCLEHPDTAVVASQPDRACGATRFTHLEMFGNGFELREDIGCTEYTLTDLREP